MADNDEFRRQIASWWRKPYDAARGNASPQECAELCPPALAACFQRHGCPKFEDLKEIVASHCALQGQTALFGRIDYVEAEAKCRSLLAECAGTESAAVVECATRACLSLVLRAQTCGYLHGDPGQLLAQETCIAITRCTFLDRLSSSRTLERFQVECNGELPAALDKLFEYLQTVETHLTSTVSDVARKLANDPSGATVKTRPKRIPKRSAVELMGLRLA